MGAQGSTTVNFGSFPGSPEAQVTVSGQTGFVSSSLVEAYLLPVATSDHSVDEHVSVQEAMMVTSYYLADGSFRIIASVRAFPQTRAINGNPGKTAQSQTRLLYGQYTIGWVWN